MSHVAITGTVADMNVDQIIEEFERTYAPSDLRRVTVMLRMLDGSLARGDLQPLHAPHLLYFPQITDRPWHDISRLPWVPVIEDRYPEIRAEYVSLLRRGEPFVGYEDPYTQESGWDGWTNFTLYRQGNWIERNAERCPATRSALSATPHGPRHGMFTILAPGARLTPHSGGVNVILTCHLAIDIPDGCAIRVGQETRVWEEGKVLLFDDSFLHEVWHRGSRSRGVLVWDIWHPDLTNVEITVLERLFPLFEQHLRERTTRQAANTEDAESSSA